jgi:hypothetical protein
VSQKKIYVPVLYALKSYFKCGNVHKAGGSMMEYSVGKRKCFIENILSFFDQRVFISEYKSKQYLRFRSAVSGLCTTETESEKALSGRLSETPRGAPLSRDWLAGFRDAQGCFYVAVFPSKDTRIGFRVIPKFFIGLSEKEENTRKQIHQSLQLGFVRQRKDKSWMRGASALKDLNQIMILLDQKSGKRSL